MRMRWIHKQPLWIVNDYGPAEEALHNEQFLEQCTYRGVDPQHHLGGWLGRFRDAIHAARISKEGKVLDKNIPADHIRKHYQSDDYLAAVLIYRGKDGKALSVKHEYATAAVLAGEKRQAHFRAANADGADIYVTVNSLVPGTHHREKRDVQTIRHLYLDVDLGMPESSSAFWLLRSRGRPPLLRLPQESCRSSGE